MWQSRHLPSRRFPSTEKEEQVEIEASAKGCRITREVMSSRLEALETWVQSLGWEDPLEKGMAPVFWPREFHGQRNLAGYSPWGRKEMDMTE